MSVYNIIVFVLMITNFAESNQYTKVIRHCLFVYTLVGVRSQRIPYNVPRYWTGRTGHLVPFEDATNTRRLMRYCDMDEPIRDHDPFMNRIVAIVAHKSRRIKFGSGEVIATGVFINSNHVLSSYNPFRNLRKQFERDLMRVYSYRSAWKIENKTGTHDEGYVMEMERFSCARQVIPMLHHRDEQWHGPDHLHSPVHDLIVFRTKKNIYIQYVNVTFKSHEWAWKGQSDDKFINLYPTRTALAKPGEGFADKLKFVSLGFIDDDHITNKNHLHTVQLDREDRVLVNCGEWFIRAWGHFICIKNVNDYIGIGSGAFLFSNNKAFGVGSFALKKGNDSILVFTDIRPYYEVIFETCTGEEFQVKDDGPGSTGPGGPGPGPGPGGPGPGSGPSGPGGQGNWPGPGGPGPGSGPSGPGRPGNWPGPGGPGLGSGPSGPEPGSGPSGPGPGSGPSGPGPGPGLGGPEPGPGLGGPGPGPGLGGPGPEPGLGGPGPGPELGGPDLRRLPHI